MKTLILLIAPLLLSFHIPLESFVYLEKGKVYEVPEGDNWVFYRSDFSEGRENGIMLSIIGSPCNVVTTVAVVGKQFYYYSKPQGKGCDVSKELSTAFEAPVICVDEKTIVISSREIRARSIRK